MLACNFIFNAVISSLMCGLLVEKSAGDMASAKRDDSSQ